MKLSIITINYNNAYGLEKTIESVVNQSFTDLEYIVIDGGSTDGSVEVIEKYQQHISYWISEKDTGVYNAMNKGIEVAKGDYLLMLNSGDYLVNKEILTQVFSKPSNADLIYGDILWDDNGSTFEGVFPDKLTFQFFRDYSLGHQTTFIRRNLHTVVGLYDENYRIVSDWKFFMQAVCKYNASYEYLAVLISVCARDGLSCKPENWSKVVAERESILKTEFAAYLPDYKKMDDLTRKYDILRKDIALRLSLRVKKIFNR